MLESYGKLPLVFELNQGQSDREVKFLARGPGYALFLTPTEAVFALRKAPHQGPLVPVSRERTTVRGVDPERTEEPPLDHVVLRMQLLGANSDPQIVGLEKLPGKSNYFIGNDPEKWRTNVPTYAKAKYKAVYPGVDLVYYGNQGQLEYDFVVAPGADPKAIRLTFQGIDEVEVDDQGDLLLHAGETPVRFRKPAIYQEVDGFRRKIAGGYVLQGGNQVSFRLGAYNLDRPLVVDPVLVYSTYLGGSGIDSGTGIAVDSAGSAYVTGITGSFDFPTVNPLQPTFGFGFDAFIAKLNPSGSALVYSTYLGGSIAPPSKSPHDQSFAIAVDSGGSAYVIGGTDSTDFPVMNPLQPTSGGCVAGSISLPIGLEFCDAFVAKLDPSGSSLVYSTYLGGTSTELNFVAGDIAVDSGGSAYVTGATQSSDFPISNPLQPTMGVVDAFVAKLNPPGSALVYSTYLGGSWIDVGNGIAVDAGGDVYVTGATGSGDFPTMSALQPGFGGGVSDIFVAKLNSAGTALIYSTYLGGSAGDGLSFTSGGEVAVFDADIAIDGLGNAYIIGPTDSTDFPTLAAFQPAFGGGARDAFVSKLNPSGSALIYSTYLGGTDEDRGLGIAADANGNAYVTGATESTDFPTLAAFQPTFGGGPPDAFVAKLDPLGSALVYSTYLGGSRTDAGSAVALDAVGNTYVTGITGSFDFPTVNPLQPRDSFDAFVAKIASVVIASVTPPSGLVGTRITITGAGFSAGNVEVFFNGLPGADVVVVNDTTILVTVPNLLPGPVEITVTTTEGKTTLPGGPGGFTVTAPIPTLSE